MTETVQDLTDGQEPGVIDIPRPDRLGTVRGTPLVTVRSDDAAMLLTVCDLYAPHEPGAGRLPSDIAPVVARVREAIGQAADIKGLAETIGNTARAYGVTVRVSEQWAVGYGGTGLNDGSGYVEFYDDKEDAREHLRYYARSRVVRRTVVSLPWEAVADAEPTP